MTKYILQSGGLKDLPKKIKKYNEEVFRDFMDDDKVVKVLMCFFAMPREDWEEKYEVYKANLRKTTALKIEVQMAMPDEFVEQCEWADVVFISGGDDDLIKYRLDPFDISKMWKDKVITTNSAASNYLVKSFWTCDWRKNMDGRSILPIKFIPHFKSKTYGVNDTRGPIDWDLAYKTLEAYQYREMPIHALEEGNFVVFEV